MTNLAMSRMVERSEAQAYASLARSTLGAAGAIVRCVRWGTAVAVSSPAITGTLNLNRVIGLGVDEPVTESLLDQISALYGADRLAYAVELAPFAQPPEIAQWLRARRLRRSTATALHWRRTQPLRVDASALAVRQARGADRWMVAEICCSVFLMPAATRDVIAMASDEDGWRHWLAWSGDTPVAAALSYIGQGVAWLGWDATLADHRGLGAQAALIAERVNDAARAGCTYATSETAPHTLAKQDASYRNYEKLGFILAHQRATHVALPATSMAPSPAAGST